MDSLYYIAHTARARCDAGVFTLMGRRLVPMATLHYTLLVELLGGFLHSAEPGPDDLEVISRVCSRQRPTAIFADFVPDDPLLLEHFASVDIDVERHVWREYFHACFGSKPPLRDPAAGFEAPESNVHWLTWCGTALVREGCATREEVRETLPVAEMLWEYEAMREQRDRCSYIAPEDEPVPTADELAAEEAELAAANVILTRHFAAICAARELAELDKAAGLAAEEEADAIRDKELSALSEKSQPAEAPAKEAVDA